MNSSSRISKAIKVLQGQYKIGYSFPELTNTIEELMRNTNITAKGVVVHLEGEPGCGLSASLEHVVNKFGVEATKVNYNFSFGKLSLLDNFAISLAIRSPYEHLKKAPLYMDQYINEVGLKLVVVDDLERFEVTHDNSLAECLVAISEVANGLVVLYTTHYRPLARKIEKIMKGRVKLFRVRMSLESADLCNIAFKFLNAANGETRQSIRFSECALEHIEQQACRLDEFVKILEVAYAYATLRNDSLLTFSGTEEEFSIQGSQYVEVRAMLEC
ncbi:hypothetical protein E2H86_00770 [Pseudomonas putida]|jgi:hypothetical protein|uniref:hypothetical protein n=1 Tax=Pseudomonas putida TaxID=303 RepID=UPI001059DD23|nr:hypothetical protein [Pseudomonas putida]TDJ79172.1 hypothetical protein E2H86_00770 [Pseudomonas putida]